MPKLAIRGGPKIRERKFPGHNNIGVEEQKAVERVLASGKLSRYLGCWGEEFLGGETVRALEAEWQRYFRVKHAIAVNSATSGLYCAVGACGAGPGDEIIVSPYTMSASAVAPLIYNAVPVFADIEAELFDLDPDSIEQRITERTKAIIVVDLFGQPYDVDRINAIAKKHGLVVIEDAAQAPGAMHGQRYAGTLGDIGVFSLNYHKHIHTGEGGIVATDDDELATRVRLIRNHAEAVVEDMRAQSLVNMIGFNLRMTEVEAAIALEQLRKLGGLIEARLDNVAYIAMGISDIPALNVAKVRQGCKHAFYVHALTFNREVAGISREQFVEAMQAELPVHELRENEGVKISSGYVKPLYLQPIYQKQVGFGARGCPFLCPWYTGKTSYARGTCPVCERMHFSELIAHEFMVPSMGRDDLDDVIDAFHKVWENRRELV